jgi:ABC-type Na+ efflux pump permease subunit
MALQKLGFRPRVIGYGPSAILFYFPWLVSLLLCGALGAYLSSRARATREISLLASVFPVLALTAAFLLMFPIDVMVQSIIGIPVDFGAVYVNSQGLDWLDLASRSRSSRGRIARARFLEPAVII